MTIFACLHKDAEKPLLTAKPDAKAAALHFAEHLGLRVYDRFIVESEMTPEVVSLDAHFWEMAVEWSATTFGDLAWNQVTTQSSRAILFPDLREWWMSHEKEIAVLEESLNKYLGLGQIGTSKKKELFEVASTSPYVVTSLAVPEGQLELDKMLEER